ncbi:MAG: TIGR00282 family metallophosphoesterase [Candidatus Cloacimonetes bacterium]|nr:TIGR00282 family metallophosphoesterase [Candidatus Cloacimonadota bacterium]
MKILFIGDIFGKAGRQLLIDRLSQLKNEFTIDVCIANGENVAQGRGITEKTAKVLFAAGVDLFTSGNHLWDKKASLDFIASDKRILKPINFPEKSLGNMYFIYELEDKRKLAVFTVIGQSFMGPADSPFVACDNMISKIKEETSNIFVDFHAEATAEKRALGHYLDGRVGAVVGTHTHIQTADEEILAQGTAYITDAGMTGAHDSVIGVRKEIILQKLTTGMPARYEPSDRGLQINAVVIEIDDSTGKALNIIRIKRKYDD